MKNVHIEEFKEALKSEKLKFTEQRFAVLKYLVENKGHFDCDDIIFNTNKQYKIKVSRATVYRTLDLLVKYNFVKKMTLDDGIARYEGNIDTHHHDHMICIETGKIIEFTCQEIEDLQDEIAEQKGYRVVKHVHQLFVKPLEK